MLPDNPKVSIIIPAYNVEEYIGKAIQSVVNQTYAELELIVVNDGSTDDTEREACKYSNLANIIIINQQNKGVSAARNNGLNHATGKWCVFLDGDDFIESDLIETLVREAEEFYARTGYDNILIGTNCRFVNQAGEECFNRITKANEKLDDIIISAYDAMRETGTSKYILQSVWCKMFLMKTIKLNRLCFNESYPNGEDGLFVFEYLCKSNNLVFVDSCKWNILVRDGSVTRSGFNEKLNSAVLAIQQMIKEAPDDEIKTCLREYLVERTVSLESKYILSGGRSKKLLNYYRAIISDNVDDSGNHSMKKRMLYYAMSNFPMYMLKLILNLRFFG